MELSVNTLNNLNLDTASIIVPSLFARTRAVTPKEENREDSAVLISTIFSIVDHRTFAICLDGGCGTKEENREDPPVLISTIFRVADHRCLRYLLKHGENREDLVWWL
ncbi:hypothetical protein Salat_0623300 [Sesamum alatum]|uniref:Uncharacterized protein n=1 Tax=Sesamum alatum TaxID=300844 RepID=A0AAE1YQR0_9LAMI|nr:hypothetical protein Salat_0623300 [Sesamum alatum]